MFILVGSKYFFNNYLDFTPQDTDWVELLDNPPFKTKRTIRGMGKDIIQLRLKSKEELISDVLAENFPLAVGKFLVPEFCIQIGFTIMDLPKLAPLINELDSKHKYEEIIYNAYIENKGFYLTQEQRDAAYSSYKQSRVSER